MSNTAPFLRIKKYPEDFIVEEIIDIPITTTKKPYIRLYCEKKNCNTMDIVSGLCATYNRPRKAIGIGGLKDKRAITRQRFSFTTQDIEAIGGLPSIYARLESNNITILQQTYSDQQLTIGSHRANAFTLIVRPVRRVDSLQKTCIDTAINALKKLGFMNTYGTQRFGKQQRNYRRAVAILEAFTKTGIDSYQQRFAVQAYQAYRFNKLAEQRPLGSKRTGDITKEVGGVAIPTGAVLGYNLTLAKKESRQWALEQTILKTSNYHTYLPALQNYSLPARRRPLWVIPQNMHHTWTKNTQTHDELHLSFTLPVGSYATELIASLEKSLRACKATPSSPCI